MSIRLRTESSRSHGTPPQCHFSVPEPRPTTTLSEGDEILPIQAFKLGTLMTELVVSPICTYQVSSAASVMAHAFADAPRFRFLVPEDGRRQAKLRWYWGASIRACVRSGGSVHVAHEKGDGAVLGVAIWDSPDRRPHSAITLLRSGLWSAPVQLGIRAYLRRRALGSVLAALASPHPCWYLNAIAPHSVHAPARRGARTGRRIGA